MSQLALSLVDTHAHLDAAEFQSDQDQVISRAQAAGLAAIVTVGVDLESSRAAIRLAERYPSVVAAVGIHPHNASGYGEAALLELQAMARHDRVVAIGEIGLDYYRNRAQPESQRRVFAAQLSLAASLGLPVIVHDREAHDDVLQFLRRQASLSALTGVLHCFSGDVAMAQDVQALGFLVSVAGPITYPKSQRLADVVRSAAASQLLVETDCPYLPPQSVRGQRNEPAFVQATVDRIAALRGETSATIAAETAANASRLFGPRLPV